MLNRFVNKVNYKHLNNIKNKFINKFFPPVLVLLYHRVECLDTDPQLLSVKPINFERHIQFLESNYNIISLDDDWGAIKDVSIAITFDDGYADNYLNALPILEKYEVPATFFISTGFINKKYEAWWDELERIFLTTNIPSELKINNSTKIWNTSSSKSRYDLYKDMHKIIKQMSSVDEMNDIITSLRRWSNVGDEGRASHRFLTIEQLKDLSESKYSTIGAHTENHISLSKYTLSSQKKEILRSKELLEKWTGKQIKTFSYPFGDISDYSSDTVKIVKKLGFSKATSNYPGVWNIGTDLFQIPRILVRDWDVLTLNDTIDLYFGRYK